MERFEKTPRTSLKRLPDRGSFDREVVYGILDEAFICHVGYVMDGQPYVIPTGFARIGDDLYIHGSAASRMLRNLSKQGSAVSSKAINIYFLFTNVIKMFALLVHHLRV